MANPPIRKSQYTRERCIQCIRECSSCQEFQQRYFAAWRQVTKHYPELKELYPWQRRPHRTPEQRKADEEAKAQRKAEREARHAELAEERRAKEQRRSERLRLKAEREEEKARLRKQREDDAAARRAERKARIEAERKQQSEQRRAEYLDGKRSLCPARLKWTEERVREALLECGDMQTLRKTHRRAFNLVYSHYRHLLDLLPDHKCASAPVDHKAEADRLLAQPKRRYYKECMHLIYLFNTEEEFREAYPDHHAYAIQKKDCVRVMTEHFHLRPMPAHTEQTMQQWLSGTYGLRTSRGDGMTRAIYLFLSSVRDGGYAYVGMTKDVRQREKDHRKVSAIGTSPVARLIHTKGIHFDLYQLTDYLPEEQAVEQEGYWQQFFTDRGFNILSRRRAGSLGGSGKRGVKYWKNSTARKKK